MRHFLRKLTLFLLMHFCLWVPVLWSYVRQRPFSEEVGAATNDKQELLERQRSPRIILVGGSNLNFGIDAAEIESRTGYHPVNMGLNVGDGLAFMLKNVGSQLRRGDVVVVSPEYEHFGDFFNGKGDFLYAEIEHRPSMIKSLTLRNWLELSDKGYIVAGGILRYTVQRRGDIIKAQLSNRDNPYRRDAFDQYGSLSGRTHQTSFFKPTSNLIGPADVQVTPEKISRAINALNEFNEECRQQGVRVFYSFPPVPRELFARHGELIREISDQLHGRLRFTILNTPDELAFPAENFFDGVYHLTAAGSSQRTGRLIDKLLEQGVTTSTGVNNNHP